MHIGSGLGGIVLFICGIFWLGEHPGFLAVLDFLFQLFLFCLLGKIVLVPAFYLGVLLKDWRIVLFGFSFMFSVFIRWMIVLLFDFRIGKVFPVWNSDTAFPTPWRVPSSFISCFRIFRLCGRLKDDPKKSGMASMALTFCAQSACSYTSRIILADSWPMISALVLRATPERIA